MTGLYAVLGVDKECTATDINDVRDAILKPAKVDKVPAKVVKEAYDVSVKNMTPDLKKHWAKRTNNPYKNIIKDKKYYEKFLNNLNKIEKDELIVHKVTDQDKEGVKDEYDKHHKNLEKHDGELKVIYSISDDIKKKHLEKFEYNHVAKFRMPYDPSDHNTMKKDQLKYYKQQQKKYSEGTEKNDDIFRTLIEEGIFDKDEIEEADNRSVKSTDSSKSSKSTKSTKSTKGVKEAKKESKKESKKENNKEIEKETKKEVTKETGKKQIVVQKKTEVDDDAEEADERVLMYRNRQKK